MISTFNQLLMNKCMIQWNMLMIYIHLCIHIRVMTYIYTHFKIKDTTSGSL